MEQTKLRLKFTHVVPDLDDHCQNGVRPGGHGHVSGVAAARAARRAERDNPVEEPRPVPVAVGDDGAARVAPARLAVLVSGADDLARPPPGAVECGDCGLKWCEMLFETNFRAS